VGGRSVGCSGGGGGAERTREVVLCETTNWHCGYCPAGAIAAPRLAYIDSTIWTTRSPIHSISERRRGFRFLPAAPDSDELLLLLRIGWFLDIYESVGGRLGYCGRNGIWVWSGRCLATHASVEWLWLQGIIKFCPINKPRARGGEPSMPKSIFSKHRCLGGHIRCFIDLCYY